MEAQPDQIFLELFEDLEHLARDLKTIEFRARKVAQRLMRRRAVFEKACAQMGIKFIDQSTAPKEA